MLYRTGITLWVRGGEVLYRTGITLWFIGMSIIPFMMIETQTHWRVLLCALVLIGIFFYGIGSEIKMAEKISRALTKEVIPQQVTLQGQNSFRAQVQIVYKDGNLESVGLVPKTTALSEFVEIESELMDE